MELIDPFVFRLSIFVLAIFVGYYVVWSVTPALHTPLMSVTNAISSVIVVGALIAVSVSTTPAPSKFGLLLIAPNEQPSNNSPVNHKPILTMDTVKNALKEVDEQNKTAVASAWTSKILGFFALILASVNIFGGFLVTQRMLAMYRKKEKPKPSTGQAAGQSK
jgi:NAD(P) transhydrogenase subunit alpha